MVNPPAPTVSFNVPLLCQSPVAPNPFDDDDTGNDAVDDDDDPVSPVIVTTDPAGVSCVVDDKDTVNVLRAPENGVLCLIDKTLKDGTTTLNGSEPFVTPYRLTPGFVIAACAIMPTVTPPPISVAFTLTAGED